jgi:signal transduction histidine kinase/PAS domain-containing protein
MLSAAICLVLGVLAWQRRPARGAVPLAVLMLAVVEISIAYALELTSADLQSMLFWAKVQYIGFVVLPVAWLVFALEFAGRSDWLTRRRGALLAIEPAVTLLLVWTTELHGLFYRSAVAVLDARGPFVIVALEYGPYFWLQGLYTYALVLAGCILIIQEAWYAKHLYRLQALTVLIAALLPWIANLLYVLGINPFPHVHLAAFAFALSGAVIFWALFRFRLLDIMPVARDALVDGMDDAVIVVDELDRVVDFNRAAQQFIDVPGRLAIGQPAAHILVFWPSFAEQNGDPGGAHSEIVLTLADNPRYYDLRISNLVGNHREITGRLFVLRDITDRKRAEQAEQEQRAFAQALRDAAGSLASTLDLDAVLNRILAAAARVVPYDCGNIMLLEEGEHARVVRIQDFTGRGLAADLIGQLVDCGEIPNLHRMIVDGQPMAVPDVANFADWVVLFGREWIQSYVGAPIRVKSKTMGFLNLESLTPGFFTPTDAQRLQAFANQVAVALENAQLFSSLQQTNHQLQSALRAKDEMVQNVSHELRGPLTVLLAYLEVLANGEMGPLNELQQHSTEILRGQGTQLQYMVERLLTLQTFAAEKLQRAPLALGPWLERTVALWDARARHSHVRLCADVAADVPLVIADSYFLSQVLDNLLDNALKFSPQGGEVTLRAWGQGDEVVMAVCDQGIGIPPDKIARIFERFYQVDGTASRRFGGMGIGLALCRTIVEAHSGRIWAESQGEGHGTTFYVALDADREAVVAES